MAQGSKGTTPVSILICVALLLTFTPSCFGEVVNSPPIANPLNVWVPIIASAVGAIIALMTTFLKDYVILKWTEDREKISTQREVLRNYVAPLVYSCEKLVWRFKEIFIDEGHQWLLLSTAPLDYNEYKRTSTLYRISSLLGWIRAISLELSALPHGASGFVTPISSAIASFQKALADGQNVELHRLEQLCDVWGLDVLRLPEERKNRLATRLEVRLYALAGDRIKKEPAELKKLANDDKLKICTGIAQFLYGEFNLKPPTPETISEKINTAIDAMTYREALIYRDWQDAIGDSLIERDEDSSRRYKIIGFEKFVSLLTASTHSWFVVFREGINDINFEVIDPNDFRTIQLKNLAISVSEILIAISNTSDSDLLDPEALQIARQLALLRP